MAPAPVVDPTNDLDFGGATSEIPQPQATTDDKPFDDEPFDAGVESNEESDPKKFIEQLTGKLGQSLRKYNEAQGQPDFELEKFAINSLLSATHTSEMDAEDQKDIIKKVKSAGNTDGNSDSSGNEPDEDTDDLDGIEDFDDEEAPEEEVEENILGEDIFLDNPKKNNMFQPNSNDILDENKPCLSGYKQIGEKVPNCVPIDENLVKSNKNSMFDKIKLKLQETFNQEDSTETQLVEPAPVTEPKIAPSVIPAIKPSRRNKPFLPSPTVQPDPKAIKENLETKKIINIKGLEEMKDLLGYDNDRLKYIVNDIRKEITNNNIHNNVIVATDNNDTNWIFNVLNMGSKIYLEFNGTAK